MQFVSECYGVKKITVNRTIDFVFFKKNIYRLSYFYEQFPF